jgi:hypothetical protein
VGAIRISLPAAVLAALAVTGGAQQEDTGPRQQLQAMERALADAVARVSRPAAIPILGAAEVCRGYRLHGVGAWFVVSPRTFPEQTPRRSRQDPDLANADQALAEAITGLRQGVKDAATDEERRALEGGIEQLTSRRRELRAQAHDASERERELKAWQERAQAMHQAAEEARQDARRALDILEKTVGPRLAANAPGAAGAASRPANMETEDALPPLPPWRIWSQPEANEDTRAPDVILRDVREAITHTLEEQGPSLAVPPEEMIAVAVDFFRPMPLACSKPPARTLVVRAPKRVLEALHAGRLAADDARKQIDVLEY